MNQPTIGSRIRPLSGVIASGLVSMWVRPSVFLNVADTDSGENVLADAGFKCNRDVRIIISRIFKNQWSAKRKKQGSFDQVIE